MAADFAAAPAPRWSERENAGAVIGKQTPQAGSHGASPMLAFITGFSATCDPAAFRPVMDED